MDTREYLRIAEAAEYIGVSSQTLRRWDSSGKLKSVRQPGSGYRFYRRADLDPFRLEYQRAKLDVADGHLFEVAIADIEGNERLRETQCEAHKRVAQHFTESREPAILQIPVGGGKTGIIATLPFGIARGRALVITPNTTIRRGVAEALDLSNPKCFWIKRCVLSDVKRGPFVAVLDGPNANIHDCLESHFVVANIQQLASSADRWLPQFPTDFFDMILVDEGHHNVAESWRKVFDRFPDAKVISLTATPFRSDGKPLVGRVIYRYSYAQAMLNGYIKQITSRNVAPAQIAFTYRNDRRRHTLAEVMELREEAWFRKGVALAPECNQHIAEASIIRCNALRERTGLKHQVIAAACSVDHARDVAALYQQRGYAARAIHSDLPSDERDRILTALFERRIDCIVQVQMLGEGFDHPPLSVAAVFRPYRSLSPYVQFVGRIMRVNHQNDPDHPDNQGFVISHVGLNNDANWNDFREVDLDDQKIFRDWVTAPPDSEPEGNGTGKPRRFDGGMLVQDEIISHFIDNAYLDPDDDRVIGQILSKKIPGTPFSLGDFTTADDLREKLRRQQAEAGLEEEPRRIPVQPQARRRALKKRLAERTNSVVARVLDDLAIGFGGRDVGRVVSAVRRKDNRTAVTQLLNRRINDFLGIKSGQRASLGGDALERALNSLDDLGDEVRDRIMVAREQADGQG